MTSDPPSKVADEDLQEELGARVHAEQDARWADAKIDGRVHWSIREANKLYSNQLTQAVKHYYVISALVTGMNQPCCPLLNKLDPLVLQQIVETAIPGHGIVAGALAERAKARPSKAHPRPFRVCVRKRPLLSFETNTGEFESVSMEPLLGQVVCHDGKLARSGRRLEMTHREYRFDTVWDKEATDDDVFASGVKPLVDWVSTSSSASRGSTLVCYGQTGTGKTHTMMGALQRIAQELVGRQVEVVFYEIHGKKCYDLLNERAIVHLRADANDKFHIRGARRLCMPVGSAEELMQVLQSALQLRSVEVTERNPISSRSHAVCEIRLLQEHSHEAPAPPEDPAAPPDQEAGGRWQEAGYLRLVDLAGSERNYETVKMTPQQHKDSAEINTALMALKDCFRAHAALDQAAQNLRLAAQLEAGFEATPAQLKAHAAHLRGAAQAQEGEEGQEKSTPVMITATGKYGTKYKIPARAPYRASRLTQVLRECFTDDSHRTVVIATVSPAATDLMHTINSLRHTALMAAPLAAMAHDVTVELSLQADTSTLSPLQLDIPIKQWTHEQVVAWVGAVEGGRFQHIALPPNLDGSGLLKLSAQRLSHLFEGEMRAARAAGEGTAWNVGSSVAPSAAAAEMTETEARGAARAARDKIGRALFAALRQELKRIENVQVSRRWAATGHVRDAGDAPRPHQSVSSPPAQAAAQMAAYTRAGEGGGEQVLWWHDGESAEGAEEAAAAATALVHAQQQAE